MRRDTKKDLRDVQIRTIDGFQGGEASVVIFYFVVTNRPGSVRQGNRLNVGLTRAKDGGRIRAMRLVSLKLSPWFQAEQLATSAVPWLVLLVYMLDKYILHH